MTGGARQPRTRGANGRFASAPAAGDTTAPPAAVPAPEPAPVPSDPPPLELYLLRHADAGDAAAWPGDDAERPLSKKGRRQAKGVARLLRDLGLRVDAVISSPLLRATQTAKPVAKATGVQVLTDDRLGYDFGRRELAAMVAQVGVGMQRVILVGHDPGFTEVASLLAGTRIDVAKGALVRIDLADREVRAGAGELRWLVPPDAVAR